MKFILRLSLWATVTFAVCWLAHPAWQRIVAALGAGLAAPRGSTILIDDFEFFYPFDVGVFVALCLSSTWSPVRGRTRAIATGVPVLVLLEVIAVSVSLRIMLSAGDPEAAWRSVDAVVRILGLVGSAAIWLVLLGGERLSLTTRRWIAD